MSAQTQGLEERLCWEEGGGLKMCQHPQLFTPVYKTNQSPFVYQSIKVIKNKPLSDYKIVKQCLKN